MEPRSGAERDEEERYEEVKGFLDPIPASQKSTELKLMQEPHVVAVELANVGNVVTTHAQTLDP